MTYKELKYELRELSDKVELFCVNIDEKVESNDAICEDIHELLDRIDEDEIEEEE